jgi:hypothetical protein
MVLLQILALWIAAAVATVICVTSVVLAVWGG